MTWEEYVKRFWEGCVTHSTDTDGSEIEVLTFRKDRAQEEMIRLKQYDVPGVKMRGPQEHKKDYEWWEVYPFKEKIEKGLLD